MEESLGGGGTGRWEALEVLLVLGSAHLLVVLEQVEGRLGGVAGVVTRGHQLERHRLGRLKPALICPHYIISKPTEIR